jgi:hypothetical protein
MRKLFSVLGGVLAVWICWGLYRFLSPGWAFMSIHDKLYATLFFLAEWSPAIAIIVAGLLYDRNRRRGSLAAYLGMSLIWAVGGFVLGSALGIASACSLYGGNLCPIVGIAFGPFGSALAIVLAAGWWRTRAPIADQHRRRNA